MLPQVAAALATTRINLVKISATIMPLTGGEKHTAVLCSQLKILPTIGLSGIGLVVILPVSLLIGRPSCLPKLRERDLHVLVVTGSAVPALCMQRRMLDVSKMMARLRAVPVQTWLVAAICLDERNPKTEIRVLVFTSVLQSIKMRSEVYPMIAIATGMMKIDDEEMV